MTTLYLADAPTYASHTAAYPENGAAILALPAGTRRYIEDMGCEVVRGPGGKFWVPSRDPQGPRQNSGAITVQWVRPAGVIGVSSVSQQRKRIRPVYFKMPGFRPTTTSRISIYQVTNGTAGAGTDAFALRFYPANPDGSPIIGAAPFAVCDWNSGGTGGAGTASLTNAANNAVRLNLDIANGPIALPPHFWCGFISDIATAAVLQSTQATAFLSDYGPIEQSGGDPLNPLFGNTCTGYQWDEATAWSIGNSAVWPASGVDYTGANCIYAALKVTA